MQRLVLTSLLSLVLFVFSRVGLGQPGGGDAGVGAGNWLITYSSTNGHTRVTQGSNVFDTPWWTGPNESASPLSGSADVHGQGTILAEGSIKIRFRWNNANAPAPSEQWVEVTSVAFWGGNSTTFGSVSNGFGDFVNSGNFFQNQSGQHLILVQVDNGEFTLTIPVSAYLSNTVGLANLHCAVSCIPSEKSAYVIPSWIQGTFRAKFTPYVVNLDDPYWAEPGIQATGNGSVAIFVPEPNYWGLTTRIDHGLPVVSILSWDPTTWRKWLGFLGLITGPGPAPSLATPHYYSWAGGLHSIVAATNTNSDAPLSGPIPNPGAMVWELPMLLSYYDQPFWWKWPFDPWQLFWNDADNKVDQLKLKYTWPDGVQADPVGELHLHREDESFAQYGFVRWELFDPMGRTTWFDMSWQQPGSGVVDVNVDGLAPFDRFILEMYEAAFLECVNHFAPTRLLAALKLLGADFSLLPPPEILHVPSPSQDDFNYALVHDLVEPGPGNNNVSEYQWKAGRTLRNRLDTYASHKYNSAGFQGMAKSKMEVVGSKQIVYRFKPLNAP